MRIVPHLPSCLFAFVLCACAQDTIDHWRDTGLSSDGPIDSSVDAISSPFQRVTINTDQSVNAIWGLASDDLWAVCDGGIVLHRNAAGWSSSTTEILVELRAVWGRSKNDIWATGGQFWVHYDGTNWGLPLGDPKGPSMLALWGTDTTIWGAGIAGQLMRNSGGSEWQEMPELLTPGDLHALWGSAENDVWAVGSTGAAAHFDGQNWTVADLKTQKNLRGIWGASASDIWVVGDGGLILHYDGIDWTEVSAPSNADLKSIWGHSPEAIWTAGSSGTVMRWDGSSWTTVFSGTTEDLKRVWGISNTLWITGSSGTLLRRDDIGRK